MTTTEQRPTEAEIQQGRSIKKTDIIENWQRKGIPDEDIANQLALDLVLEQERAQEWRDNYEALVVRHQALQKNYKDLKQSLDLRG